MTVEPKPGRALMWPSVLDDDPSAIKRVSDHRTTHEALTVTRGRKLAANMWLHQCTPHAPVCLSPPVPCTLSR